MMLQSIDLHKRVLQLATMCEDSQEVLQEARMPACREALSTYLLLTLREANLFADG